jgi:cytochrome c oxidase subunit 2
MQRVVVRQGVAFVTALLVFASAIAAADVAAGKSAYMLCQACHGANGEGNKALNAPRIVGQESWYISRQLVAYRAGHRGTAPGDRFGMQMRPMAMALADPAAEANVIEYLATLSAEPSPVSVQGDVVAGKAGYLVCQACHGPDAGGLEALGGPQLAGQDDWYLVRQLQNFKNGLRAYDPADTFGQQMKPMAAILADDKSINDVVAYISTLR